MMNTKSGIDTGLTILKALSKFTPPPVATTIDTAVPIVGALLSLFWQETKNKETETVEKIKTELDAVKTTLDESSKETYRIKSYIDKAETNIASILEDVKKEQKKSEEITILSHFSTRMATINACRARIDTNYEHYISIINDPNFENRKKRARKLISGMGLLDIPAMLNQIGDELVGTAGGSNVLLLKLYKDYLVKTLPFQHNIIEPLQQYQNYMTCIQIKALTIYAEWCSFMNAADADATNANPAEGGQGAFTEDFALARDDMLKSLRQQQGFVPQTILYEIPNIYKGSCGIDAPLPPSVTPAFAETESETHRSFVVQSNLDGTGIIITYDTTKNEWNSYPTPRPPGTYHHNAQYVDSINYPPEKMQAIRTNFAGDMNEKAFVDTYIAAYGLATPTRPVHVTILRDGSHPTKRPIIV